MARRLGAIMAVLGFLIVIAAQLGVAETEDPDCAFCGEWEREGGTVELLITVGTPSYGMPFGFPFLAIENRTYPYPGAAEPENTMPGIGMVVLEYVLVQINYAQDNTDMVAVMCYELTGESTLVQRIGTIAMGDVKGGVDSFFPVNEEYVFHKTGEVSASLPSTTTPSTMPSSLRFVGSTNTLTDPFTLPAGSYRVHLVTAGAPFIDVVPVATPRDKEALFHLWGGEAVHGMSTLYVSDGRPIMLQFSYVDAQYELWFERI